MKKNSRSSNKTSRTTRTAPRSASARSVERNRELARSLRAAERAVTVSADLADAANLLMQTTGRSSEQLESAIDSFAQGLSELTAASDQLDALIQAAGSGGETISEILYASEDITRTFDRLMKLYHTITALIVDGDRTDTVERDANDIEKSVAEADAIIKRAFDIAEKFDVASLNTSLEAGRGDTSPAATAFAEAARSTATSLLSAVKEFSQKISELKKAASAVKTRRNRLDERMRTVSVLTKSIRTAIDDIGGRLETFRASADDVSLAADDIMDAAVSAADETAGLTEQIDGFMETLDSLSMLHEMTMTDDTVITDITEELVTAAAELSGARTDASSDILELCENLRDALARFGDRISLRLEEYGEQEETIGLIDTEHEELRNAITGVTSAVERAETALEKVEQDYTSFRERFADAGGVLRDMSLEFQGLCREEASFRESLEELRTLAMSIGHYSPVLLDGASRCEMLSLTGSLGLLQDNGDLFKGLIGEIGGFAADLAKLRTECDGYAGKVMKAVSRASREAGDGAWALRETVMRGLVADLSDLENESVQSAGDGVALAARLVSDCGELASKASETAALSSVVNGIEAFVSSKESADTASESSVKIAEQISLLEKNIGRLLEEDTDE